MTWLLITSTGLLLVALGSAMLFHALKTPQAVPRHVKGRPRKRKH